MWTFNIMVMRGDDSITYKQYVFIGIFGGMVILGSIMHLSDENLIL